MAIDNINISDEGLSFDFKIANQLITSGDTNIPYTPDSASDNPNDSSFSKSNKYANWFDDNNRWPTLIRSKMEQSPRAMRNIMKLSAAIYGQGFYYYKEYLQDGKILREDVINTDIDDFITNNDLSQYFIETIFDFNMYFNTFNKIVLNQGSTTVVKNNKAVYLMRMEPEWSRLSKTNKGIINKVVYSPGFVKNGREDVSNQKIYKSVYSANKADFIKFLANDNEFVYPVTSHGPGRTYYAYAPWASLVNDDSWLDVAINIPKLVSRINSNMVTIKYHIEIPIYYFKAIHNDWDKYSSDKREKEIKKKLEEFSEKLKGTDGDLTKAIVTLFDVHQGTGKELPGIKITPLQDYIKKDSYLPNSEAANKEISYAQGVDGSMANLDSSGGNMGAGSGSVQRVSQNNMNADMKILEDIILQPIRWIARFNQWPKDIKYGFRRIDITPLNENKTGISNK